MEKLIELLNEYWEYDLVEHNWEICKWATDDETGEINIYTDYTNNIISKKFWFIKWLVDNDKIDTVLFANELNKVVYLSDFVFRNDEWFYKTIYKQLLMLLSIQDNPIEFLCSVIK